MRVSGLSDHWFLREAVSCFGVDVWTPYPFDQAALRHVSVVALYLHGVMLVMMGLFLYRPLGGSSLLPFHGALFVLFTAALAFLCLRVRRGSLIRWHFLLVLALVDWIVLLLTEFSLRGVGHTYVHLIYYPVAGFFVVLFHTVLAGFVFVSLVVAAHVAVHVSHPGFTPASVADLKLLVAWVAVMYVLCGLVVATRGFWSSLWHRAYSDNQALIVDRVEFSRGVHDTAAQMAYMVSLGIDSAVALSDRGDPALPSRLASTSVVARSLIWQLRHSVDVGPIYEGEGLRSVLRSNVASYSDVTSVRVDFDCRGEEPDLPVGVRRVLFTVAHNALANTYRHGKPSLVRVELLFSDGEVRLAVSDDGPGLPDGYERRGRGFANMSRELAGCGGVLVVERSGALGGATVGAVVPVSRVQGG